MWDEGKWASESAPRSNQSVATVRREGKGKGYVVYRTAAGTVGMAEKVTHAANAARRNEER